MVYSGLRVYAIGFGFKFEVLGFRFRVWTLGSRPSALGSESLELRI
jgi:hypothetical protein